MRISALPVAALLTAVLSAAPPTMFVAGDSSGWCDPVASFLDPAKVTVANRARAGSGSRAFFTQGAWQSLLDDVKHGDFVLLQFSDGRSEPLDRGGSLPGIGDETREVSAPDGKSEIVHTYGWYLRRFVADARSKGATPIVLAVNEWAAGIAHAESAPLVDMAPT